MNSVVAVVLAGGTGTRLYPAARPDRPKQFLTLDGDRSLLARSLDRARFADRVAVVTREAFADRIAEHAPPGVDPTIIVEPTPRDTGPALLYATRAAARIAGSTEDPADGDGEASSDRGVDPGTVDDVVVVAMPADHHVGDDDAFRAAAGRIATVAAATGRLVTLGIEPDRPATGYGYIEPGSDRAANGTAYREVEAFHEKPDRETATAYCVADHRWNAGVFAWTPAALFSAAADTQLGGLAAALRAGDAAAAFTTVDPISIDNAVLEPAADARRVAVVDADIEWDDLGTWAAIARLAGLDGNDSGASVDRAGSGNRVEPGMEGEERTGDDGDGPRLGRLRDGNATVATGTPPGDGIAAVEATDNLVVTDDTHISLIGVEGLAVVSFDDRVLVVPRENADQVRKAVAQLREQGAY